MFRKIFFVCFALLCLQLTMYGQDALTRADMAFAANEYSFAITYYKSVFNKLENDTETKARIAYNIGLCNKRISKPLDAQLWLEKAIELKHQDPAVFLHVADVLRMNEQFDKAIEYYNQYKLLVPHAMYWPTKA